MQPASDSKTQCENADKIIATLISIGFTNPCKIMDTLQGSIWKAKHQSTNENLVIKVTSKNLHSESVALVKGIKHNSLENIISEAKIQKYLTNGVNANVCPKSIVKYVYSFQSNTKYFLVMEYGGSSLFDFIVRIHQFIAQGIITINEWHKAAKVIFNQMIECVEYIHNNNVCHFDISLENFLINDIDIKVEYTQNVAKITFPCQNIQIKLCDFGLAELFAKSEKNCFLSTKFCGKSGYQSPEMVMMKNQPVEIVEKQKFDAKQNDIWCLGVCLWLLIVGRKPWLKASKSYESFNYIMNGYIMESLYAVNQCYYVNEDLITLFKLFFQYEQNRCNLLDVKNSKWCKGN